MLLVEIINHRIMTIRIQDVGCQRKYQKANHVWMDMNGVSRIKKPGSSCCCFILESDSYAKFAPKSFRFQWFSSWSISSSHILKAELANALQALPARKVPCPGMLWILLAERYVKKYVMVLLWKERICPKICQRKDLSKAFLMFLYFRISVLTFYIKLLYVVRVLGVKHLYIWNTGTNTKYYRNKLIFDITCTTYHWYSLIVIVLFSHAKVIPKSHLIEATEQTHPMIFDIWSHWTPQKTYQQTGDHLDGSQISSDGDLRSC